MLGIVGEERLLIIDLIGKRRRRMVGWTYIIKTHRRIALHNIRGRVIERKRPSERPRNTFIGQIKKLTLV